MFTNHLKTTVKNLATSKLYSTINIVGLATSLVACIIIALHVQNELSFDKHWSNSDQLFRVNRTIMLDGSPRRSSGNPLVLAPALKRYFSQEIDYASRVMGLEQDMVFENESHSETVYAVDPDIVEMLDFEVIAGSLSVVLGNVNSIAIRHDVAEIIFGEKDPIGSTISIVPSGIGGITSDLRVDAIYKLPEENTILDLPALFLFDMEYFPWGSSWAISATQSYIQLSEEIGPEDISPLLPEFANQNVILSDEQRIISTTPSDLVSFDVQNISELYLNSSFDTLTNGGNRTMVLAFTLIAILVLLIGSINFMVLTTVRATQRSKEVAMRKIVGAGRNQLIVQFMGESLALVLISIIVALGLLEAVLPVVESITAEKLVFDYSSYNSYILLSLLLFGVGSVGGVYPALVLSRFHPTATLKAGQSSEPVNALRLRSFLVILQFSISIALIIGTLVIFIQMRFINVRDPGFNKENLIVVSNLLFREEVRGRKALLKEELLNLSSVTNASLSIHQPTQNVGMANAYIFYTVPGDPGAAHPIGTLAVDEDFFDTYEIELLAGREFTADRDNTPVENPGSLLSVRSVIVNASAVTELGFRQPVQAIGEEIVANTDGTTNTLTIVGVVDDTDFFNLRADPRPEIYTLNSAFTDVLTLRYQGSEEVLMAQLIDVWNSVMGEEILSSSSVTELMSQEFSQEQVQANILTIFSVLAIVIACLGLFGSVSYSVDRRKREIGIRKILGAKVSEIVAMLIWYFSKPVFMANLIAWPAATWIMLGWLEQFPYQIDRWLLLLVCIIAAITTLLIAWLTVGSKSLSAALNNPIDSIRYE